MNGTIARSLRLQYQLDTGKKLTQADVARITFADRTLVSKWERGMRDIAPDQLKRLENFIKKVE